MSALPDSAAINMKPVILDGLKDILKDEANINTEVTYNNLLQSFHDGTNIDIIVETKDRKQILAHKLILSAASPTFKANIEEAPRDTTYFSVPYLYDDIEPIIRSVYDNNFDFTTVSVSKQMRVINICLFLGITSYINQIIQNYNLIPLTDQNFNEYLGYLEQFKNAQVWSKCMPTIQAWLLQHIKDIPLLKQALNVHVIQHLSNPIVADVLLTAIGSPDEYIMSIIHSIPLTIREILHVFTQPHFKAHPSVISFISSITKTGKIIKRQIKRRQAFRVDGQFLREDCVALTANGGIIRPKGEKGGAYILEGCYYISEVYSDNDSEPIRIGRIVSTIENFTKEFKTDPFRLFDSVIADINPIPTFGIFREVTMPNKSKDVLIQIETVGILHSDSLWNQKDPRILISRYFRNRSWEYYCYKSKADVYNYNYNTYPYPGHSYIGPFLRDNFVTPEQFIINQQRCYYAVDWLGVNPFGNTREIEALNPTFLATQFDVIKKTLAMYEQEINQQMDLNIRIQLLIKYIHQLNVISHYVGYSDTIALFIYKRIFTRYQLLTKEAAENEDIAKLKGTYTQRRIELKEHLDAMAIRLLKAKAINKEDVTPIVRQINTLSAQILNSILED